MGIEIRRALPEDASAACEVLRRSIAECCVEDHRNDPQLLATWLANKTPENVASWFLTPSNYTVVAVRDGQVIGVSLLTQAGKLSLCYVLPEALHGGAGKAMLANVEAQARQWGVSVIRLHSTAAGRDFYARHGYISAGRDKSCFGLDCDLFWKKLNADVAPAAAAPAKFCPCSGN
jgi:N-acetylglutamate synthase-like GNAT family acetyltransferase